MLPNTVALTRAEALYVELTGAPRERLGQVLAGFRAALEKQDSEEIDSCREALVAVTRDL